MFISFKQFFIGLLLTFCVVSSGHSQAQDNTMIGSDLPAAEQAIEQAIIHSIDADLAEATELLKTTVNINSGTMNFAGVKAVADKLAVGFNQIGMETQWIDGAAFNRAGHLVAKHRASNEQLKILMIGHLDTVFAKDAAFQAWQQLDDRYVKAPGITDMKGGNVIILYVLKALKEAGVLDKVSVDVVLTGDEESRGSPHKLANKALIDSAKWADIALGFEDGDGDPKTAVISRRGAVSWTLTVSGKPAHSSQVFREDIGFGAIYEASRIITDMREQLISEQNLTFNPGLILGGTDISFDAKTNSGTAFGKTNVIARDVIVRGDVRAISPEQLTKAKRVMQAIVAKNLAHTNAKLVFANGYPPMAPRKSNYQLLSLYNEISQQLGYGEVKAVDPRRAGAADISFAANHVAMAMDGLGLMGDGGHTDDEVADMATFDQQMKRAALLIKRLVDNQ